MEWDANSGPPSDVSDVGMLKVANVLRRMLARSEAPLTDGATMGQPEYRSTSTMYADPS